MDQKIIASFSKLNKTQKIKLLHLWDEAYYEKDAPLIDDETYDSCVSLFNEKYKKTPYTSSLGKASAPGLTKFKHWYPVQSLAKINTEEEFLEACKKFDYNIIAEPKIDGLTVVYYPDGTMVSRGDGTEGEVLPFANKIPNLPKPLDKPVRMEVYIDKVVYNTYFKDKDKTSNSRNVAAGILRRKEESNDIQFLSYKAYNILGADDKSQLQQLISLKLSGFNIVDFVCSKSENAVKDIYRSMKKRFVDDQSCPTDGVVIKYNPPGGLNKYGSTAHHPNDMIAYKFQTLVKETTLEYIEWRKGREKFTPVAHFKEVKLGDNKITAASLHNLNIMNQLGIKEHSKVMVTLKNEIIPQIVSCSGGDEEISIPDTCPVCGAKLKINDSQEVICPNSECGTKTFNTLKKIVSKDGFNIFGLSDKNLEKIYSKYKNVLTENPFAILKFDSDQLIKAGISGYTAVVYEGRLKHQNLNVTLDKFLIACDIPGVGKQVARDIAEYFDNHPELDFKDNLDEIKNINGIGFKIYLSIKDMLPSIKKYSEYVNFKSIKENKNIQKNKKQLVFAISGTLDKPRSEIEKEIEEAGHIFSSSVTKKVNYLILGKDFSRAKEDKAIKYNIDLLSSDSFRNYL